MTNKTGDAVADEDKRLRTMFVTYAAERDAADTFMVVLGSIMENFRGVDVVEYKDDTVFHEDQGGGGAIARLHEIASRRALSPEQQEQLDAFTQSLHEWDGPEG